MKEHNDLISYAHKNNPSGTRFVQRKTDTIPSWAVDIKPYSGYIVYEYNEIANIANELYKEFNPNIFKDGIISNALSEIYNGVLPRMICDIFITAYVKDYPRNDENMKKLLDAHKQVCDVGYIGTMNSEK